MRSPAGGIPPTAAATLELTDHGRALLARCKQVVSWSEEAEASDASGPMSSPAVADDHLCRSQDPIYAAAFEAHQRQTDRVFSRTAA